MLMINDHDDDDSAAVRLVPQRGGGAALRQQTAIERAEDRRAEIAHRLREDSRARGVVLASGLESINDFCFAWLACQHQPLAADVVRLRTRMEALPGGVRAALPQPMRRMMIMARCWIQRCRGSGAFDPLGGMITYCEAAAELEALLKAHDARQHGSARASVNHFSARAKNCGGHDLEEDDV